MRETAPDLRWQIAARSASRLPIICTTVLAARLGDAYDDHLAEEIWSHLGEESSDLAKGLDLPVTPADSLAGTLLEILRILFGPEFRGEILDLAPDRAVLLISRCPFLMRALEAGERSSAFFHPCLAFCVTATETLHSEYTLRFIRAMCLGDKNCELRLGKMTELEKYEDT